MSYVSTGHTFGRRAGELRHGLTLRYAFKTYHTIFLWNLVPWRIVSQNSELIKFHLLAQRAPASPKQPRMKQPNIHRIRFAFISPVFGFVDDSAIRTKVWTKMLKIENAISRLLVSWMRQRSHGHRCQSISEFDFYCWFVESRRRQRMLGHRTQCRIEWQTNEMEKRREWWKDERDPGERWDDWRWWWKNGIYGFGKCVRWWNDTKRKLNTVHVKVIFQPFALARIGLHSSRPPTRTASFTSLSSIAFLFFPLILIFIECFNLTPSGFLFGFGVGTNAIH